MGLLDRRQTFKPFEYSWAERYWNLQQLAHWVPSEVSMAEDIQNWSCDMTEPEKQVVGMVLKGFVQAEVVIGDYWSTKVANWFPKPEVALMCSAFGAFEGIHQIGYAYLNDSLGLTDYGAFMEEPSIKGKIDRLMDCKGDNIHDIARTLAIFSAFTEGVSLFSSFAVLLNFQRRGLLKGVGQIVSWSIRDESLHSEAGCHLFRQICEEYPEVRTAELRDQIYEAARLTVALEDDFIDKAFSLGELIDFSSKDLKNFIRFRANTKLGDLGYAPNWRNISTDSLNRMTWFDAMSAGTEHGDFFAVRNTAYSKGGDQNWDSMW
jgi:ribonucleoside-diphosphate reductase beta chain